MAHGLLSSSMHRIGVLTSGGDAPGMNAAIRAVVRTGISRGLAVCGIRRGFSGLIDGDIVPLDARAVGGTIGRPGTMLRSARCPEFKTEAGRAAAVRTLTEHRIDGVVVIGGNGSQTGAHALAGLGVPVVGVASTIDNDLVGSDITIGVDTALNVAVESIDRLRATADSHHRAALVEVMGRDCGYLALIAGIAGGAEVIVVPESPTSPAAVAAGLRTARDRGKESALVVVAEGATPDAEGLARYFVEHREELGYDLRVTTLGHVQRGGVPTVFDRLLGTRLGAAAAETLARGEHGVLVGLQKGLMATTPLADVIGRTKGIDPSLLALAHVMER